MTNKTSTPVWFWIIAVILTVWNAMGAFNYISQVTMSEEAFALLDERMQTFLNERPAWGTAGFAIAVWGGLLASLFLLLKKKMAGTVYIVSLLGVLISISSDFMGSLELTTEEIGFNAFIVIVTILSIWFSRFSAGKDWLK